MDEVEYEIILDDAEFGDLKNAIGMADEAGISASGPAGKILEEWYPELIGRRWSVTFNGEVRVFAEPDVPNRFSWNEGEIELVEASDG